MLSNYMYTTLPGMLCTVIATIRRRILRQLTTWFSVLGSDDNPCVVSSEEDDRFRDRITCDGSV